MSDEENYFADDELDSEEMFDFSIDEEAENQQVQENEEVYVDDSFFDDDGEDEEFSFEVGEEDLDTYNQPAQAPQQPPQPGPQYRQTINPRQTQGAPQPQNQRQNIPPNGQVPMNGQPPLSGQNQFRGMNQGPFPGGPMPMNNMGPNGQVPMNGQPPLNGQNQFRGMNQGPFPGGPMPMNNMGPNGQVPMNGQPPLNGQNQFRGMNQGPFPGGQVPMNNMGPNGPMPMNGQPPLNGQNQFRGMNQGPFPGGPMPMNNMGPNGPMPMNGQPPLNGQNQFRGMNQGPFPGGPMPMNNMGPNGPMPMNGQPPLNGQNQFRGMNQGPFPGGPMPMNNMGPNGPMPMNGQPPMNNMGPNPQPPKQGNIAFDDPFANSFATNFDDMPQQPRRSAGDRPKRQTATVGDSFSSMGGTRITKNSEGNRKVATTPNSSKVNIVKDEGPGKGGSSTAAKGDGIGGTAVTKNPPRPTGGTSTPGSTGNKEEVQYENPGTDFGNQSWSQQGQNHQYIREQFDDELWANRDNPDYVPNQNQEGDDLEDEIIEYSDPETNFGAQNWSQEEAHQNIRTSFDSEAWANRDNPNYNPDAVSAQASEEEDDVDIEEISFEDPGTNFANEGWEQTETHSNIRTSFNSEAWANRDNPNYNPDAEVEQAEAEEVVKEEKEEEMAFNANAGTQFDPSKWGGEGGASNLFGGTSTVSKEKTERKKEDPLAGFGSTSSIKIDKDKDKDGEKENDVGTIFDSSSWGRGDFGTSKISVGSLHSTEKKKHDPADLNFGAAASKISIKDAKKGEEPKEEDEKEENAGGGIKVKNNPLKKAAEAAAANKLGAAKPGMAKPGVGGPAKPGVKPAASGATPHVKPAIRSADASANDEKNGTTTIPLKPGGPKTVMPQKPGTGGPAKPGMPLRPGATPIKPGMAKPGVGGPAKPVIKSSSSSAGTIPVKPGIKPSMPAKPGAGGPAKPVIKSSSSSTGTIPVKPGIRPTMPAKPGVGGQSKPGMPPRPSMPPRPGSGPAKPGMAKPGVRPTPPKPKF